MDNVNMPIAEGAQEHIHSDECIMALGDAHTVELFLKAAAKRRRFQVRWNSQDMKCLTGYCYCSVFTSIASVYIFCAVFAIKLS